jgi:hypothetical protein
MKKAIMVIMTISALAFLFPVNAANHHKSIQVADSSETMDKPIYPPIL